jgi:hypothetical protein
MEEMPVKILHSGCNTVHVHEDMLPASDSALSHAGCLNNDLKPEGGPIHGARCRKRLELPCKKELAGLYVHIRRYGGGVISLTQCFGKLSICNLRDHGSKTEISLEDIGFNSEVIPDLFTSPSRAY